MSDKIVNIKINNQELNVSDELTIMQAASQLEIHIPRLCFLKGINENSSCRICLVEVKGARNLKNACSIKVEDGMEILTNTKRVRDAITKNLNLLAANHVFECWRCSRENNCEFLELLTEYDVENIYGENANFEKKERIINDSSNSIVLDSGKCLLCSRCISACKKQAGVEVLGLNNRGFITNVGPALNTPMEDSGCIYCGKCIQACPVAAISEKDDTQKVIDAINDENKFVVVQAAPSVRVALGEEFGIEIGTNVEKKMYSAFNKLGFDDIIDTNYGADLTILEEGTEFINRIQNNGTLPMFTSCSPGWIRYIEQYKSDYLDNLSSCKSPQVMTGSIAKHYYADKIGVNKKDMYVVSIMPCIAKKDEISRDGMEYDGVSDVDVVLTTRELARLIKKKKIDFNNLEDYNPTSELAQFTGAGAIFGATGGVMEAALRTVVELLEKKELEKLEFTSVRGLDDIKETTLKVLDIDVNIAVVHGGKAIQDFFEILKTTDKQYHFVEFMGCTGGCVNGGGQPIVSSEIQEKLDVRKLRAEALYNQDESLKLRKSHENEAIKKLYEEFLTNPGSHLAHDLLHVKYSKKDFFVNI